MARDNRAALLPTSIVDIAKGYYIQPPEGSKAAEALKSAKSSGSSKKSSGGGSASPAPPVNYASRLQGLIKGLYETTFASDPVVYEQATEQELKDQITAWLRPAYDQAIYNRGLSTGRANAELDADAIARGMGASTFVTDVKSRNFRDEAHDVALLESEYGATLARNVTERLEAERARALEVDLFNKEQAQADYRMAYDAAALLTGLGGSAAGLDMSLRRGGNAQEETAEESAVKAAAAISPAGEKTGASTSAANCATFLARLTPAARAGVYAGTDAQSVVYRNEIIASVGLAGFYRLQSQYGA